METKILKYWEELRDKDFNLIHKNDLTNDDLKAVFNSGEVWAFRQACQKIIDDLPKPKHLDFGITTKGTIAVDYGNRKFCK